MKNIEDFKERVASIDKHDCDAYFKIDEICFEWFKFYFESNKNSLALNMLESLKKEIT